VRLPESDGKIDTVGQPLAELTCSMLGCQRVGIFVVEQATELLRPIAVVGLAPEQERAWWEEQRQQESTLRESPTPELVERLRAGEVIVLDMRNPPFNDLPNPYNIKVMLTAPMNIGARLVGLLTLDYGGVGHSYSEGELALASAVGKLSALVIERQRLLSEQAEAQGREVALQESNRRMEEFLGVASHELRTPLTTIKANIQLAMRRLKSLSNRASVATEEINGKVSATQDMLTRAERQVGVLNRLVGDMIDISRIQADKLQVHLRQEPTNLVAIVQEVVQEQRKAVPGRSILLEMPATETIPILADPDRIGQVLTNYISNALKYSEATKSVEVRLTCKGQMARVSVRDEGPGLSGEEQQRIWECFYQAPDIKVMSGSGVGLGLGLYISQTVIQRHQGQVGVQSTPGKGSTFWFTLPIAHLADTTENEA
ncbi:MAG TPA: HAMP domain-containing sensor histidine kinase, partial [Ktedonobacteraceae bacterium]|nr:HAMP domain-containing sensor histidine kinase [Ktedonobacteraceae bacterium]